MKKIVILLDSNIIINLFYVQEDIEEILTLLGRIKEVLNSLIVTTNIVIEEIGGEKHSQQREFLKEKLLPMLKVIEIDKTIIEEFRVKMGMPNIGMGEASLLYLIYKRKHIFGDEIMFILISTDKKDVLKRICKIINIYQIKNVKCLHGLFLYFLMFRFGYVNKDKFHAILFSSNRDLRLSLKDSKEIMKNFEKEFRKITKEK